MTSARLALPLLEPGQAQKEMTHNAALAALDLAVQASVVAVGLAIAPAAPAIGASWIVGTAPTGDWAGQANAIAGWTASGWRFAMPAEGWCVWSGADGAVARFTGGVWTIGILRGRQVVVDALPVVGARRGAIADPAGGTIVDGEARTAILAILAVLRGHGLIGIER